MEQQRQIHWDSMSLEGSFSRSDAFFRTSPHIPASMKRGGSPWSIGQFILHEQIYKGKSSRVYAATDKLSLLEIVVKYYKKQKLTPLNRYQVEREIEIHLGLHHQNVIMLYAAFEDESNVYMVLERATGGDLFQRNDFASSSSRKDLEMKMAVNIVAPFLNVLSYLHGKGIIHRDIKPENILVMADDTMKIADFGLAIDMNSERPVTRTGTLDYMAPEVLRCPDKTSPEQYKENVELAYNVLVDVWAVGILVFELLAGQAPFEKESRLETYHNILSGEPEFPAWLSPGAVSFIKIALCKDANNRPTAEKLYRHPWLQSFVASKQEFRSSTGGIREKTLSAIPKQKSPENTSSSASSVPTLNRSLLTDPAAKPETTQEGQSTDKILRQISASGQNILKPNESFSATSFNGTAEWDLSIQNSMSVEKMSYESSILYGSSGSSARNGSFLDVLASGSSGSKPYCISNNGSSPSPPGQSQMIQHMLANASPTLGGGSPVPFNRQVSLPFTPHPPPLIHLHSLQHQPPLPPSSSKGSGSSRTNRPPPLNTPPSILESIPGSSKPSSSGSSFSQSNSLATVVEKAAGGAGEKTSAFLPGPASMSIYHPLHRMKLQVQVHAEMSQSNSEGQVSTPLSTPGSNQPTPSGPSSGNLSPYGFLHQKRASHQGSAMPSILRSPSMVNKTPESPGQSSSLNGIQFSSGKSSANISPSTSKYFNPAEIGAVIEKGLAHVDDGVNQDQDGVNQDQAGSASTPTFAPLRRRSSLPGILRSSNHPATALSCCRGKL